MRTTFAFALLVTALLATACDGGGGANALPTAMNEEPTAVSPPHQSPRPPTPTPTPSDIATSCPVEQTVCDFAIRLARLVELRDVAGIVAAARPRSFVCSDVAQQDRPVCESALAGETRLGFALAFLQSKRWAVDEAALTWNLTRLFNGASPALSDEFGGGGWTLVTIGCGGIRRGNVDTVSCDIRFGVVFTAIGDYGRVIFEFVVEQQPTPAIEWFVYGAASANREFVWGGRNVLPLRHDIEDRNGTHYFPVRVGAD